MIALDHFLLGNSYRHIISNAAKYEVAKKTASYRERGLSNEDSLQEICNILAPMVLPLDALKIMRLKGPAEEDFYKYLAWLSLRIRRDQRNRLIPSE